MTEFKRKLIKIAPYMYHSSSITDRDSAFKKTKPIYIKIDDSTLRDPFQV